MYTERVEIERYNKVSTYADVPRKYAIVTNAMGKVMIGVQAY